MDGDPTTSAEWDAWRTQWSGEEEEDITDRAVFAVVCAVKSARERVDEGSEIVWGGSRRGKRANLNRDIRAGAERIYRDYFSSTSTYTAEQFERRYRMPREVFVRLHNAIVAKDEYFCERRDATGKVGASSFQKLTAALRMLAYGASSDSLDEYYSTGLHGAVLPEYL